MAAADKSDPKSVPPADGVLAMAEAVSKIAEHLSTNVVQQVPLPNAIIRTPFNPTGKKAGRAKLKRDTFLTGYRLNDKLLTEDEINEFNKLRPGRYQNRRWNVIKREDGAIELRYPNATIEQRMEQKGLAPDCLTMLRMINAEYEKNKRRKAAGIVDEDE